MVPMDKVDSLQGQMGNVSREVEIPGNDGKEMLEIQDIETKIKNAFDRLMNKWEFAEQTISELEDTSKEACKTGNKKKKLLKEKPNRIEYLRTIGQLQKFSRIMKKGIEEIYEIIKTDDLGKLMSDSHRYRKFRE